MIATFLSVCLYVGVALILLVGGLLLAGWILGRLDAERQRREEAELLEKHRQEQSLRDREEELQQQTSLAVINAVKEAREAAQRHYQSTIPAGTMEQLETHLKANQLMFHRLGQLLSVRVAGTPTGWVGIEWTLNPSLPAPLRIVGKCQDKTVFVETAFRGIFTNIYRRGRRYEFAISAYGEKGWKPEDEVKFIIKVPSHEEWTRTLNPTPKPEPPPPPNPLIEKERQIKTKVRQFLAADELWDQGMREGQRQIETSAASDLEKRRRRARLEAQLNRERDREE